MSDMEKIKVTAVLKNAMANGIISVDSFVELNKFLETDLATEITKLEKKYGAATLEVAVRAE